MTSVQDLPQRVVNPDTPIADDALVISGMSSLMPECRSLVEFSEKLYHKENLVKRHLDSPRWKYEHPELPQYYGRVPDMDRFDAQFFMIHPRLSHCTDAMSRRLFEQAYQALFDAGVCPTELSEKKVGVFVATGIAETEKLCSYTEIASGILGCNRTMYANRISYCLNTRGPSYTVDAGCCSSLVALEKACEAILHGECDSAIVGAAKGALHPHAAIHYQRLIPINSDGKTKCYDENADGQTVSEAVNAFYIQKYKDARKVYAEICYVKNRFAQDLSKEFGDKYGPFREPAQLSKFLGEFYDEAGVSPSSVEYIEGFGAALPETDKAELLAVQEVFCKNRKNPMYIGSVTSNIGYTDAASGTCGLVKILLAYQRGEIAANLHCATPRRDVPALRDGRLQVLTDHKPFHRTYTAINGFSIMGTNTHALFKGHYPLKPLMVQLALPDTASERARGYKKKDLSHYQCNIPNMVTVSGRLEDGVHRLLDDLGAHAIDPEELTLLHSFHKMRISKHTARGYGIFKSTNNETVTLSKRVVYHDDIKRPLWFVYSGMGSQWARMGSRLMDIPIFAAAIQRCHNTLAPKGVDLIQVITTSDKNIFDNILNAFVGITAIQIALTDVLKAVGLFPDRIMGHSVGELGCAYADGCGTLEEIMLLSYYRGLVSIETPLIKGSMAAIGIGYKRISKFCPPDIEVACHNGPDSSTISGPADSVKRFVTMLQSQGVFAKEVKCANIAYHSRYVSPLGESLLKYSREVIKIPKLRNERWASTSVPKDKWNEPQAQYYSAEYNTNNLLSPVLFEETMSVIPSNAVLVELAPHGLLQAILKRSLPDTCRQVPLTRRDHDDSVLFLLEAIGRLYTEGYDVDLCVLYPKIEFPVSTGTRHISHLMNWDHTEQWNICLYVCAQRKYAAVYKPLITVYDEEYHFLLGSVIEGIRVLPFSGVLVFVWDILAMSTGEPLREQSVEFNNVHLYYQPQIHDNHSVHLTISLQRGCGRFEVSYEKYLIADGFIKACSETEHFYSYPLPKEMDSCEMSNKDIYKMLFVRGYEYSGEFRSIDSSNISLTQAKFVWQDNWVTFVDGALHLNALRRDHNAVSQPQHISSININVDIHESCKTTKHGNMSLIDAQIYENDNVTRCGGLLIKNIFFKDKPVHTRQSVALKYLSFIPFVQDNSVDVLTYFYVFMQIVAENINKNTITLLNVINESKALELDKILDLLHSSPEINLKVIQANTKQALEYLNGTDKPDVTLFNQMGCENIFKSICLALPENTFIVKYGGVTEKLFSVRSFNIVSAVGKGSARLELVRWKMSEPKITTTITVQTQADYEKMREARNSLNNQQKLNILTSYPALADLKDIVKQWRAEKDRNQICLTVINPKNSKEMNLGQTPHNYLAFNVLHEGFWGGEYYIPYKEEKIRTTATALRCTQLGDLSSLQWLEVAKLHMSRDVITVHFAGLNVYDAKLATAEITNNKQDPGFGMDFSGVTQSGDCVMGLISEGAARSEINLNTTSDLLWPVPKHWSLEDAATVPFAYCFAFFCLGIKSKPTPGMNVLIHGGAGALGQAAISIALANGCKVFTTVSDTKKKKFLKQMFPTLPGNQIGNSRDITFKDMILASTKRKGCHIIINCLKGELKAATLSCCAVSGIIFDVVQIHTNENFQLGLSLINVVSYVLVDFPSIFTYQKREEIKRLWLLMSEGISRGYVRPLSRVTYPSQEVQRAFRLLTASQHRGRVLLSLKDSLSIVQPRLIHSSDAAFLLLCDKEGFGLQIADMLISQGARNFYLHIEHQSAYHRCKLLSWQNLGVRLQISTENLTLYDNIIKLLKETTRMGQVEGIFIITETFINESKDIVISNVDTASRKMCPYLRYFAVLTKNGTAAGVCVNRAQYNLPALAMQLDLKQFDYSGDVKHDLEDNKTMKWDMAGNAIESALLSKKPVMIPYLQSNINRGLLDEVARVTGFSITTYINDKRTLEQVGIDCGRAHEMSNIFEEKFNISIPKEIVPQMTIEDLLKLQIQVKDIEKDVSGLSSYFNYVEPDEMLGSAEVIMMPTLVHKSEIHPDEFESNQTFLCIVPGLEGHQERFRKLCERIKLPTVVLQLGLDRFDETIQEMAQRLVNVMVKKLKIKHFHLMGYEFGALLALEMAVILENYGITGNIYCLGGTPEDIRSTLEDKLNGMHEKVLEGEVVKLMYYLLSGKDQTDLDEDLRTLRCFSEKVDLCVWKLHGKVPYTTQYMRALMKAAYARIQLARKYITEPYPLEANVILLRPILQNVESVIPKFSRQDILTYQLSSSLTYAPQDLRCAAIINKHIEPEVLEKFNKKNQCESFLLHDNLCMKINVND